MWGSFGVSEEQKPNAVAEKRAAAGWNMRTDEVLPSDDGAAEPAGS